MLVDGGAAITDPHGSAALNRIDVPTRLLWAPRGILDQSPGLFTPELIEDTASRLDHVTTELVDDVNHYTLD